VLNETTYGCEIACADPDADTDSEAATAGRRELGDDSIALHDEAWGKTSDEEAYELLRSGSVDPASLTAIAVLKLATLHLKRPVARTAANEKLLDVLAEQLFGLPALA